MISPRMVIEGARMECLRGHQYGKKKNILKTG
jgi:hypothetical protein